MALNQDQSLELQHLHDYSLIKVEVMWAEAVCHLHLVTWSNAEGRHTPVVVELTGVKFVSLPRNEPWGPSSSINSATFSARTLSVEMQSGDLISISAEGYRVVPSNHSLEGRRP